MESMLKVLKQVFKKKSQVECDCSPYKNEVSWSVCEEKNEALKKKLFSAYL